MILTYLLFDITQYYLLIGNWQSIVYIFNYLFNFTGIICIHFSLDVKARGSGPPSAPLLWTPMKLHHSFPYIIVFLLDSSAPGPQIHYIGRYVIAGKVPIFIKCKKKNQKQIKSIGGRYFSLLLRVYTEVLNLNECRHDFTPLRVDAINALCKRAV